MWKSREGVSDGRERLLQEQRRVLSFGSNTVLRNSYLSIQGRNNRYNEVPRRQVPLKVRLRKEKVSITVYRATTRRKILQEVRRLLCLRRQKNKVSRKKGLPLCSALSLQGFNTKARHHTHQALSNRSCHVGCFEGGGRRTPKLPEGGAKRQGRRRPKLSRGVRGVKFRRVGG